MIIEDEETSLNYFLSLVEMIQINKMYLAMTIPVAANAIHAIDISAP